MSRTGVREKGQKLSRIRFTLNGTRKYSVILLIPVFRHWFGGLQKAAKTTHRPAEVLSIDYRTV
jgi:hypothetical protein